MTPGSLSLLYLPPFSIVARFFLTASLFGLLGVFLSLYMVLTDSFNLQALVHTYTLGFMATTMFGALFQMLPVVAGAVIERPLIKATLLHIIMVVGVPSFVLGFLTGNGVLLAVGFTLLFFSVWGLRPYT